MARLLALLTILISLVGCGDAEAEDLPGQMLLSGNHVDLYRPASGELRRVAETGGGGVLSPSGSKLAYIRYVGCLPIGRNGCYAEYSIFEKGLDDEVEAAGRGVLGPTDFFVRGVDVASGGKLVFSAKPGPGPSSGWRRMMEIYSVNHDGTAISQLTDDEAFDNDPAVSPDSTRIAFARRIHGRGQIFTMRLDGSGLVRVTHGNARNRLPTWSPDGSRLLYISQPAGKDGFLDREIYTVKATGGRVRRLTHNRISEGHPRFSPDGRYVAFLAAGALWAMGADGSELHEVLSIPAGESYDSFDWGAVP